MAALIIAVRENIWLGSGKDKNDHYGHRQECGRCRCRASDRQYREECSDRRHILRQRGQTAGRKDWSKKTQNGDKITTGVGSYHIAYRGRGSDYRLREGTMSSTSAEIARVGCASTRQMEAPSSVSSIVTMMLILFGKRSPSITSKQVSRLSVVAVIRCSMRVKGSAGTAALKTFQQSQELAAYCQSPQQKRRIISRLCTPADAML